MAAFAARIGEATHLAQVTIRRNAAGFELRHVDDDSASRASLRPVDALELRHLSQFTSTRFFRPLKSSPDLPSGWRLDAPDVLALEFALNQLYPGAVADWYVAQENPGAVTHYRKYTERQTGMYRVTALLSDASAREVVQACCDARFCLKQRLWTVDGLAAESSGSKSQIPCLEPCPVLMEFARKAARIDQEGALSRGLRPDEVQSLQALLDQAGRLPSAARQADFSDPLNPRRLQLLRLRIAAPAAAAETIE